VNRHWKFVNSNQPVLQEDTKRHERVIYGK